MVEGVLIIAAMTACGLVPMAWLTHLMIRGRSGLVLTLLSVLGAIMVILWFAVETPIGLDPLRAYSIFLLFLMPAMIGALSGTALGWLVRKRRDRRP
jgi:hypothetical protein